jgi:Pre-toxin TG/Restriction endonuclease fold toxin 2
VRRRPAPGLVYVLVAILASALAAGVVPGVAFADNCQTPADCFGVQRSAMAATVGLLALTFLSLALDFTPVVGTVKGAIEGITGRDLLTGQKLAAWERAIGWVPYLGKLGDVADAARAVDRVGDVIDAAGDVTRAADNVGDVTRAADRAGDVPRIDLDALPRKPTPARTAADRYETRQTGEWNYQVEGGGERVWADGVRPDRGDLLDAKYVDNPDRSPFVPDSGVPPYIRQKIVAKLEDEFRRYARVVNDGESPYQRLEVITNNQRAVPFFEDLMRRYDIAGRVVVRE